MTPLDLVQTTAPEIVLTVVGLVVLLLDVAVMRAQEPLRRTTMLGLVTALGMVGALGVLASQWAVTTDEYFVDAARVLVVDKLAIAMRVLVIALALGAVVLSMKAEIGRHVGEYFALVCFAAVGMSLLVSTEHLLMFFVALELLSLCLYALTAFHKGLLRSGEGALKYFMIGSLSAAFLIFGLAWVVGSTGAADLRALGAALGTKATAFTAVGMVFILVGLGFKLAVVPFHAWAPDAYEGAPTPITAFIATGSKVASFIAGGKVLVIGFAGLTGAMHWPWRELSSGVISAVRFEPGWVPVVALLAAASMIWGNLAAIAQRNVKRMLAYSSIAHSGYILTGLLAANATGMTSMLTYLVAYGVTNLGVFGVVAALTRPLGGDDLEDYDGLVQRAPGMALLLLVFVLSLAGIPPLAGFIAKFYVFAAATQSDGNLGLLWLVIVALVTSAVSLYYYLVLLKRALVSTPKVNTAINVGWGWRAPLVVLALLVVVLGAWPQPLIDLLGELVKNAELLR